MNRVDEQRDRDCWRSGGYWRRPLRHRADAITRSRVDGVEFFQFEGAVNPDLHTAPRRLLLSTQYLHCHH